MYEKPVLKNRGTDNGEMAVRLDETVPKNSSCLFLLQIIILIFSSKRPSVQRAAGLLDAFTTQHAFLRQAQMSKELVELNKVLVPEKRPSQENVSE